MTTNPHSASAWVPDACTLPTAERPVRQAEFDRLFGHADAAERVGPYILRLMLSGGDDLEATVRDLAVRESQCCSFFNFSVSTQRSGRVVLDVEVPPQHAAVLDALAVRARAVKE